jgi:hypothetical protein
MSQKRQRQQAKRKAKKKSRDRRNPGRDPARRLEAEDLLEAFIRFVDRKPWTFVEGDSCFVLRVPGEKDLLYGTILGSGATEFGLQIVRGEGAFSSLFRQANENSMEAMEEMDVLSATTGYDSALPPKFMEVLDLARFRETPDGMLPCFIAFPPSKHTRGFSRRDILTMTHALDGTVAALKKGKLDLSGVEPGQETLLIEVEDTEERLSMTFGRTRLPVLHEEVPLCPVVPPPGLRGLRPVGGTLAAGITMAPFTIRGSDDLQRVFLLMNKDSCLVFHSALLQQASPFEEAARELYGGLEVLSKHTGGLPRQILLTHRELFGHVHSGLESLGMTCRFEPFVPEMEEAVKSLFEYARGNSPSDCLAVDDDGIPKDEDLDGWTRCLEEFVQIALFAFLEREMTDQAMPRALKRYFGNLAFGNRMIVEFEDREDNLMSYSLGLWNFFFYRSTRRSRTPAERLAKEGLPDVYDRIVYAARDAYPSLYQVLKDDGRILRLKDLLLGEIVEVHDIVMVEKPRPGDNLPLVLLPLGKLRIGMQFGRFVQDEEVEAVRHIFKRELKTITPVKLAEKAHLFGRLWREG